MGCPKGILVIFLCLCCTHVRGQVKGEESSSTDADTTTTEIPTTTFLSTSTTFLSTETTTVKSSETSKVTSDTIYTSEPSTVPYKTTSDIDSTTDTETKIPDSTTITTSITTTAPKPSACSKSPCQNNGTCQEDNDPQVFSCNCSEGFTGILCQVTDLCVVADDQTVCKNGACVFGPDGSYKACQCFYGRVWDGETKECKEITSPCGACLNGGTCEVKGDSYNCHCQKGYEGRLCGIKNECGEDDECGSGECVTNNVTKYCECNSNHFWNPDSNTCEAKVSSCIPNPCENSGVCENVSSTDFNCSCPFNFYGKQCETPDFCAVPDNTTEECENGKCSEYEEGRRCSCNQGYFLDEVSHRCEEILPPCEPNPCKNYGICVPITEEKFNCTCSEGYMGPTCSNLDYCAFDGGHAFCGDAECRNDVKSASFFCSCDDGDFFDYISRTCEKIDFCPLVMCDEHEQCENSKCDCIQNSQRNNSTGKCEESFCASNPCPVKDMICIEGNGKIGYKCECKKGYSFDGTKCVAGSTCRLPNLNSCNQKCESIDEEYECKCREGDFKLKADNKTCEYIGNFTCTNMKCNIGTCVGGDTEECICPPGFINITGQCKDLCSANNLPDGLCPDKKCESTVSGFRCKCEGKYKLSSDKSTCTARKMCDIMEAGWKDCSARKAICEEDWKSSEGYYCVCPTGFVKDGDGDCIDVCSIEENQKICSMFGAKCDVDVNGNRTCKCPPYFRPFEEGKMCNKQALNSYVLSLPLNPDVYQKAPNSVYLQRLATSEYFVDYKQVRSDVYDAIATVLPGILHINFLNYIRDKNFLLCKVEMQFSSVIARDLKRLSSPEFCKNRDNDNSTSCLVSPSLVLQKNYIKDFVSVKKTDPCDEDLKDALCETETSCSSSSDKFSFNCSCKPGFAVRNKVYPFGTTKSSIENCRDIDECSMGNPCPQYMKCENTFGSYKCFCKSGYRIDKDSSSPKCVKLCDPNPCVHGECSEAADDGFQCRCDAGYRGSLCDMQDENFKRARTNTIIVGAVLGGVLLVTWIISYSLISRLKRKKSMDDPDPILYGTEMAERRNIGEINNAYQRD